MGRRIGARNLDRLLRRGTTGRDTSFRAGSDWDSCLKSHRMYNEGIFIITEIALDLGATAVTIKAPSGDNEPFGLDGGSQAYIMQWEDSIHGKFHLAEVYVVEQLSTSNAFSLSSGDAIEAHDDAVQNRADIVAGVARTVGSSSGHGSLDDGEYVYITEDTHSSAAALTTGQLVIRLIGIKTADISAD